MPRWQQTNTQYLVLGNAYVITASTRFAVPSLVGLAEFSRLCSL